MPIHFGFSYVGLIYLVMLYVPNIIWSFYKPKDYELFVQKENRFLQWLERIGEVAVTILVLIFSDFNIHRISYWSIFLLCSFLFMIFYELYWIRYFKSDRRMCDMYSSFLKIPVAGATLPIIAFLLLGIYGKNIFLILATILLGIGYIGIHLSLLKKIRLKAGGDFCEKDH